MRLKYIFYPLIFLLFLLFNTKTTLAGVLPYKVVFDNNKLAKSTKTAEDGNVYQALKIPGIYGTLEKEGVPELPVKYIRLIIPTDEDAYDITITSVQKKEIKLDYLVYPVQPDIPTKIGVEQPDFVVPDPDIYNTDKLSPENTVQIVRHGYFDGNNHILTLAVYPVQYNPVSGLAVFYSAIEFNIELKSNTHSTILPEIRTKKNQKMYDAALNSMVDNTGDIDKYQVKPSLSFGKQSSVASGPLPFYEYVVITSNSLKSSFDKFVRWKKHKGLDIGVVTVEEILAEYNTDYISGISDDAGGIRQYLYDAYMAGTVWVLMGGDYTVVPIRYGAGLNNCSWNNYNNTSDYRIPADIYFADFTGDWDVDGLDGDGFIRYGEPTDDTPDYSPEIYVGRLLCSSVTDVTNWTEKIIEYEQYPFQGNYSNLTRFLWSESDQLQEGNQPSGVISSSTVLSGFYNVIIGEQPSYDSTTPTAPTGAQIVSELNNGYHFYNMYNHGAPTHVLVRCPGNHDTGGGPFYGLFMYDSFNAGYVAETGNGLDNITGENKSTIIYSIGCDNAEFDHAGNPCMAEALITLNNSGGPAFLGNTRFGWIGTSQYLHRSFISRLYDDSPNLFHIGQAEAISKDTYGDHYLAYSHNLFGDPEMAVWTAVPSQFSNVSVTDNVNSITVDAGVSGSTISVCSDDDGSTYYLVADNVTNYTFTTSHRPCFITVTNENYIPYYAITGGSISQDQEWFGHMHILDDVTIPTGKALVISESSTLFFNVGKTMNVNGILNVQGTASNPVTFTRSGGSGLWAGLKINGTATIDHAIFEYAGQGVSYLNASSGSISNSELRYNNYGIYVNTSLPTIQTCNIHDNNGWGIYICNTNNIGTAGAKTQVLNNLISGNGSYGIDLYNASPSIQNNEIYNQTYGIYGYSNCSPYLGQYEVYGNNNIHDNTYGIGVMNNSNPFLGEENCVVHGGHNQFTANTNHIAASYNCYIQAEQNWWGSNPPQSSKFYITNGSIIDYTPWLVSPPSTANMIVGPREEKQFDAAFGIANDSNAPVIDYMNYYSPDWPMEHKLLFARNIYLLGDIKDSQDICKDVIANYPDSSLAFFALDLLWQSSRDAEPNSELDLSAFKKYLKSVASNKEKKSLYGNCTLVQSGFEQDKSKLLVSADKIYDGYQGTFLAEVALFQKFSYYFHEEKNMEMARVIAGQIKDEFPNSISAIKTDEFLKYSTDSQNKIAKSNTVNEKSSLVPVKFNVTFNYPNPFNPSTRIEYALPEISNIEIAIFNTLGQQLKFLRKFQQPKGSYSFTWDGSNDAGVQAPTGLYVLRFIAETAGPKKVRFTKSIKMLLIR